MTSSCPRALTGANSEGEKILPSPRVRREERGPRSSPRAAVSCGGRFRFLRALPPSPSSPPSSSSSSSSGSLKVKPVADSWIWSWIWALLARAAALRLIGALWCEGRSTDVVLSFVSGATSEFWRRSARQRASGWAGGRWACGARGADQGAVAPRLQPVLHGLVHLVVVPVVPARGPFVSSRRTTRSAGGCRLTCARATAR